MFRKRQLPFLPSRARVARSYSTSTQPRHEGTAVDDVRIVVILAELGIARRLMPPRLNGGEPSESEITAGGPHERVGDGNFGVHARHDLRELGDGERVCLAAGRGAQDPAQPAPYTSHDRGRGQVSSPS